MFGIGAACRPGRLFTVLLAIVAALYCWLEFTVVDAALVPSGIDMLTVLSNLVIGFGAGHALDRRVAELAALHAASVRRAEADGRRAEDKRADVTIRQGAVKVLERLIQSPSLDEDFKRYIVKEYSDLAALTGGEQADGGTAVATRPGFRPRPSSPPRPRPCRTPTRIASALWTSRWSSPTPRPGRCCGPERPPLCSELSANR